MKRKVLFLIESLSGGGAEKVLSVILQHFNKDCNEVVVCPIVDCGVYRETVLTCVPFYQPIICYKGGPIKRVFNKLKYKLVYSWLPLSWVCKLFLPKNNDVEIAFCEGYVTKLLSHSSSKAKKIAWIHTDLSDNPWPIDIGVYKSVEEEAATYMKMDRIVCVSHAVENKFHAKYGFEGKTCTIYNPIDIDDIKLEANKRTDNGALKRKNCFHLVSIGRLVPQKGYDRLIACLKRLIDDGYPLCLTIIGEGQERNLLEHLIQENGMSGFVNLPGFMNNPYSLLSEANLFVCSSRAEGFSLVIAEAMVLGIPVISTLCSGPNELLGNGMYGVLVDNSEEGLYHGIKNIFDGKFDTKELILHAMSRISDFAPEKIVTRIDGLLNEVLADPSTCDLVETCSSSVSDNY